MVQTWSIVFILDFSVIYEWVTNNWIIYSWMVIFFVLQIYEWVCFHAEGVYELRVFFELLWYPILHYVPPLPMIFTIVISQNERLNASIETFYLWKDILRFIAWVSEWYVAYRQLNNFSAISARKQVNFQWNNDEIRFVPDQHAYLDVL
jgi:hypothetical protein